MTTTTGLCHLLFFFLFFFGRLLLLSSKCVCDTHTYTLCVWVTRASMLPVMNIWHHAAANQPVHRYIRLDLFFFFFLSSISFFFSIPAGWKEGRGTKNWCATHPPKWCESIDRDSLRGERKLFFFYFLMFSRNQNNSRSNKIKSNFLFFFSVCVCVCVAKTFLSVFNSRVDDELRCAALSV